MAKNQRKFADDGWAVWVDGDDLSTVYINDWINPKGKSFMDLAVRIRGVKLVKALNVYVPFAVSADEIEDTSLTFRDKKVLQAVFNAACIVDFMKNEYTSEIAYNGKTMDIIHISTMAYQMKPMSEGTLITVDLEGLRPFLDNDEAYFIWRMPHKSLDEIFKPQLNMGKTMDRLRDLITTPVVSEKYGYSIRINEARLLPEEITRIGMFHRQKLKKAVITISVDESYEINDANCYRIHRLEKELYRGYLPADYKGEDVITYEWIQTRENNAKGQFNFYYSILKDSISKSSMFLYLVLLLIVGVAGDILSAVVQTLLGMK